MRRGEDVPRGHHHWAGIKKGSRGGAEPRRKSRPVFPSERHPEQSEGSEEVVGVLPAVGISQQLPGGQIQCTVTGRMDTAVPEPTTGRNVGNASRQCTPNRR